MSATTSIPSNQGDDDENTTIIIIIVIVLVCVIVLALFGFLLYLCLKKSGKCSNILRRRHQVHTNSGADQVDSGNRISLLGPVYIKEVYKTPDLFDHNSSHKTSLASLGSRCILDERKGPEFVDGVLEIKSSTESMVLRREGIKATLGLPVAPNDGRKGSTYFYGEDMGTRKSSHSSFDFSMHDLEAQVANSRSMKSIAKAPMASSETLNSTKSRPNSAPEVAISEETEIEMPIIFPDKLMIEADRPVSASLKDDQPLLPLKTRDKKSRSGVAKKLASSRRKPQQVVKTLSESDLTERKNPRPRNPFADSDEDDDFVDISDLPPVPQKLSLPPPLFPKQRINRSESDLRRINSVLRKKIPPKRKPKNNFPEEEDDMLEDYEDLPTASVVPETIAEDYDEPIPHFSVNSKQYVNIAY